MKARDRVFALLLLSLSVGSAGATFADDVGELTQEVLAARLIDQMTEKWPQGKGWALQTLLNEYAEKGIAIDQVKATLAVPATPAELQFANQVLQESGFKGVVLVSASETLSARDTHDLSAQNLRKLTPVFVFSAALIFGIMQVALQRAHSPEPPLSKFKIELIPHFAFATSITLLEWHYIYARDFWNRIFEKRGLWVQHVREALTPTVSVLAASVVASFPGLKASYDGFDPLQLSLVGVLSAFGLASSALIADFAKQGRWTLDEADRMEANYSVTHRILRVMALVPFLHGTGLVLEALVALSTTGRLALQKRYFAPLFRQRIQSHPKTFCSRALGWLIH